MDNFKYEFRRAVNALHPHQNLRTVLSEEGVFMAMSNDYLRQRGRLTKFLHEWARTEVTELADVDSVTGVIAMIDRLNFRHTQTFHVFLGTYRDQYLRRFEWVLLAQTKLNECKTLLARAQQRLRSARDNQRLGGTLKSRWLRKGGKLLNRQLVDEEREQRELAVELEEAEHEERVCRENMLELMEKLNRAVRLAVKKALMDMTQAYIKLYAEASAIMQEQLGVLDAAMPDVNVEDALPDLTHFGFQLPMGPPGAAAGAAAQSGGAAAAVGDDDAQPSAFAAPVPARLVTERKESMARVPTGAGEGGSGGVTTPVATAGDDVVVLDE